jgi:hypothetical protein
MMRPVFYVLSFLAVMGLGFWAYRENYATQADIRAMAALQDEIASLREALTIQKAEWAYLNRPSRLRDLATVNYDKLGLLPMEPSQFGTVAQIASPPPPISAEIDVTRALSVAGVLNADPETPASETTP